MQGIRRWSLAVLAVASAACCIWSRKPYADDPLVRRRPTPRTNPAGEPTNRSTPLDRPQDRTLDSP
ncbi:MAG TPA: hypothetical protein VM533_07180 [Fimbriiglobus sp.]|nr:hypothetical protein [Fimbriiglobus sp.]